MAQSMGLRRNSYDRFRAENEDDEPGSKYVCDCGEEYMSETTLQRHQQNNCRNRSVICSFCQKICPSSAELRDHLLLCGNKTDECPNCRQLIRRSHFAYHYENNCAPIDKVETPPPPPRPKNRSAQRLPTNSNRPVSREDVPSDDYSENYPGQNSSMYPPRVNGRIQTPINLSNPRNSPGTIECEYCHNQCAQKDYKTHRDNCLQNPTNINYKPQRIPLKPNQNQNQNPSNGVVHIPCEICHQPIDLPNWSNHMQDCREREKQRLANRARSMSKEPVTEQLPCEYCQELYSAKRLGLHQASCPKNPENIDSAARLARPRPAASVTLPTRSNNNRNHPTPSNARPPNNIRNVHYESIDVDRTHEANRSLDNDRLINNTNANQHPIRRTASDEALLQPKNSSRDVRTYDDEPVQSNERRPYENFSSPFKPRSPNDTSPRTRSSFDNLRNIEDNQDPSSRAVGNRSPYYNDGRQQHHLRHGHENLQVIDNHPDRPFTKKHKVPGWKKFFGCAANTGASYD